MRELEWLVPVAIVVAVEFILWWAAFSAGVVVAPMIATYGVMTLSFFCVVAGVKIVVTVLRMAREGEPEPLKRLLDKRNIPHALTAVLGLQLLAMGTSAFATLKAGIPKVVPFWMDVPIADFEHAVFGADPWRLSHAALGWATPAIDRFYATFVPLHFATVVLILLAKPSLHRSRAIVTLASSWLLLGIFAAFLMSSAGPIFFDQLYGSTRFVDLTAVLRAEAPRSMFAADALWSAYTHERAMVGNGISAMPSMHVGITLWIALCARGTRIAPLAWLYFALIWLGSVHLGWHYASDGLVAAIGVLALWKISPKLLFRPNLTSVQVQATTA